MPYAYGHQQRSKIETYGESLFIVVKTAQLKTRDAKTDGELENSDEIEKDCTIEYGETHFFVGINFLVSVRHGNAHGYAEVRKRCEEKPEMLSKGPAFALYALMDFIVDNYQPIVKQLCGEFDALEVDIFKGQFDQLSIERLYELKIKLLQLRQAALPNGRVLYSADLQAHVGLMFRPWLSGGPAPAYWEG